jgi:hypothetical protein
VGEVGEFVHASLEPERGDVDGLRPFGEYPAGEVGDQRRQPVGFDAQCERVCVFAVQFDQPARPPVAREDAGGADQPAPGELGEQAGNRRLRDPATGRELRARERPGAQRSQDRGQVRRTGVAGSARLVPVTATVPPTCAAY